MLFKIKMAIFPEILFYFILLFLHVYTLFGPPLHLPPDRTHSTLLFSDFVEEKT
jgi:hypothetical protein